MIKTGILGTVVGTGELVYLAPYSRDVYYNDRSGIGRPTGPLRGPKWFERMKAARKALRLTQEYVARQMGMSRTTIVAIEAGKREVTATELSKFADLYGVPMEKLIHGEEAPAGRAAMFARTFAELSKADQAEIMNLMRFKKRYRESLNA